MIVHVLNGDCLLEPFAAAGLNGEPLVFRECLIEGPIDARERDDFWNARAAFLKESYDAEADDYRLNLANKAEALVKLSDKDEVCLWFGDDLFCQANMWFCLELLADSAAAVYRVFPEGIDFGHESADQLNLSFANRVRLGREDLELGRELWEAFRSRDRRLFENLGGKRSAAFRKLSEVCLAARDVETRPLESVKQIISEIGDDFDAVFREFSKREAIYGLGDVQVRRLIESA
ncbi:MAG: DUF1835 domain-containing protein [Acidobacteria bacterium]|nr:DUF1835 domain-containing protein [Acidobacteriota bacterium]MBK8150090.1 DUF1835 domain-containing protein [Acidobacteriota bacterium]